MTIRPTSPLLAVLVAWAAACGGGSTVPVELPSLHSTVESAGPIRLAPAESPCEEAKPWKGYGLGAHFKDGTFVSQPAYLGHYLIPEAGLLFRECTAGCELFAPQRANDLGAARSCELGLSEPSWPDSDPSLESFSSPWRGTLARVIGKWPDNALLLRDLQRITTGCWPDLPQDVHHVEAGRARLLGDAAGGAVLEECRRGESGPLRPKRMRNADGEVPAADRSACNLEQETIRWERASGDLIGGGEWLGQGVLALWLRVSCEPQLELMGAAPGTASPTLPSPPEGAFPVAFESNRSGWATLVWATESGSIAALWLWSPGQSLPVVERPEGKLLGGELYHRHPPLIALEPSGGLWLVIESSSQGSESQLWHRSPSGWRVSRRWPKSERGGCTPELLSLGADGAVWIVEGSCYEPWIWRGHTRGDSQWLSVHSPTRFESQRVTQIMPLPSGEALLVVERDSDGPVGLHRDLWSVREGATAAAGSEAAR